MVYLLIIGLTMALTLVTFTPLSTSGMNRKMIDITISRCDGDIEQLHVDAYTTMGEIIDFNDPSYDLSAYNPNTILTHGDYIDLACPSQIEKISINAAGLEALMELPGIGESSAQKIIDYRETNGPFQTLEELMNVPGIKQAKFDDLKDYICL